MFFDIFKVITMTIKTPLAITMALLLTGCDSGSNAVNTNNKSFTLSNPHNVAIADHTFIVNLPISLAEQITAGNTVLMAGNQHLTSQWLDNNNDGVIDQVVINSDFAANEKKAITLKKDNALATAEQTQRAHAEISIQKGGSLKDGKYQGGQFTSVNEQVMPEDHKPGNMLFKFEGPGWESDKVAYRLYFDHRNVIDVFGKKVPDMVLPEVGKMGYSYHKEAPWGLDILKVGPSLGMAGFGAYENGQVKRVSQVDSRKVSINKKGPLLAQLTLEHANWQLDKVTTDVTSTLSIMAGSKLTHNQITLTNPLETITTGIVKHEGTELIKSSNSNGDWGYLATFGKQSYLKDELGMAVFYNKSQLKTLTEDDHSQLVLLDASSKSVDYYFMASWAQDGDAIKEKALFIKELNQQLALLNNPIQVSF